MSVIDKRPVHICLSKFYLDFIQLKKNVEKHIFVKNKCNAVQKKLCDQIFPDFILIFNVDKISIIRDGQASRMSEGMHNYSYHSAQNMNREEMPVTHVVPFDAIKDIHYTHMGSKVL